MSDIAIEVSDLSKHYQIGARQERYSTLRDTLTKMAQSPLSRFRRHSKSHNSEANTIWALKNIGFEVKYGEVTGIIGRNGAGKSTLLKILSRITEPSSGYARIRGRLGSMLEVGTGFHLELTGRENIYLNGAILGMRRTEIDRKFDEIVDFSGVEKFIDTAVKHYSSGMYLRLAFAVAAHLEPEILLVDEVLAVGDINFQKKCLGKMGDVAAEGRTVLFVSHNLGAVKELCTTCLVLNSGKTEFRGSVVQGIAIYSRQVMDAAEEATEHSSGWRSVQINGQPQGVPVEVRGDEPMRVDARLDVREDCHSGFIYILIEDSMGDTVVHRRIDIESACAGGMLSGSHLASVHLPALWMAPGVYTLHMKFRADNASAQQERYVSDRLIFEVPGTIEGLSRAVLAPDCRWDVKYLGAPQSRQPGVDSIAS